ncbi:MAG: hypothetical protein JRJ84_11975 [Deltaproteobacteria bacterium]|nr:hypothetical protein [Deltaproteobacteria bacterium]
MSSSLGQLGSPLGNLGGAIGQSQGHGNYRPEPKGDRSLLERAMDWVIERAMNSVLGAAGQVGSSASGASGRQGEGQSELGSGMARATQTQSTDQQHLSETTAAAGEAAGGVASAQGTEAELGQAESTLATQQGTADVELQQHEEERNDLQALLEEVQEERERQETENDAFRDQYGEQLSQQGGDQFPPVGEPVIEGLHQAYLVLEQMGDAFLNEGHGMLAGGPLQEPGSRALDHFHAAHESRLAFVYRNVCSVDAVVGDSDAEAWALVGLVASDIQQAERELLESWSETLGFITQMQQLAEQMSETLERHQTQTTQPIQNIR